MTSVLAFFVLICVLVAVHEYGHFWAARRCGVKVLRFSIGFGKVLYQRTDKQGTQWAFSLIPLGGYVKMLNGEPEGRDDERYENKTVWQRMFIIAAGPLANFLFAIVAYWAVFVAGMPTFKPVVASVIPNTIAAQAQLPEEFEVKFVSGREVQNWEEVTLALLDHLGEKDVVISGSVIDETAEQRFHLDLSNWAVDGTKENPLTTLGIQAKTSTIKPILKAVAENSVAEKAGLKVGDKLLSVNGKPFDWLDLVEQIQRGETLQLEVEQAGQIRTILAKPQQDAETGRYLLGVSPTVERLSQKYRTELKYDILSAFGKSLEKVASLTHSILQFLGNLMTGELALKNVGGPLAIAKGAGASAEIGWVYYLSFMAMISVNLGVMNLFPLLPLDGGQLVLLGFEAVRKKAVSANIQVRFQQLGMALVLGLMLFVLWNDFIHF